MGTPGAYRNIALLSVCQALFISAVSLVMTITALAAERIAPDPALATLPVALQFVGTMTATIPASLFMGRYGRRLGFSIGSVFAILGGLLGAWSIAQAQFWALCAASVLIGFFTATAVYYRFAATEVVEEDMKNRAISWVLVGGVAAAFIGPEIAKATREAVPFALFAGSYVAITVLGLISLGFISALRIPLPAQDNAQNTGRPLKELFQQPALIVAVLCAMVGYGAMNFIMVPTPLAITANDHSFATAAMVMQFHMLGMFVPSFFTGNLIDRFGTLPVIAAGGLSIFACVAINLSGAAAWQFWSALAFLGIGWNFMYIGATTLLTETYRAEEGAKVQGLNDFFVFGMTVTSALSTGAIFNLWGWSNVNLVVIVPVLLALSSVFFLARRRSTRLT